MLPAGGGRGLVDDGAAPAAIGPGIGPGLGAGLVALDCLQRVRKPGALHGEVAAVAHRERGGEGTEINGRLFRAY